MDEDRVESKADEDYEEGEDAYDDEGTLDEEEMLNPEESYQDELKMLEDDANLSIEELKRKYCSAAEEEEEYADMESTSGAASEDIPKSNGSDQSAVTSPDTSEADVAGPSSAASHKEKPNAHGYFSDVDDNDEDADYVPPDPWRRNVRQGPIYQASVPDSMSPPRSPYDEHGVLLWSPHVKISMKKVEEFLKECYGRAAQEMDLSFPNAARKSATSCRNFPLKDDEDALKYASAKVFSLFHSIFFA
ncbi:unnamed protein product [Gongylonema pulchrum]|uniref:ELM2 domain-containing protein n=1 Tax=Gongylonema pulchrum TaxID=637853 RepID=A0A183E0I7_9BILA|nr:unnamed protein product [Gongylonema pulchrum]